MTVWGNREGVWTWRDDSVGQQGGGYGHGEMTLLGNRERCGHGEMTVWGNRGGMCGATGGGGIWTWYGHGEMTVWGNREGGGYGHGEMTVWGNREGVWTWRDDIVGQQGGGMDMER